MSVRAVHQPRRSPSAPASISQLFLFTHYAHQLSRICKLLPAIETTDVVEPGAGALRPSSVPMNTVEQVRKNPLRPSHILLLHYGPNRTTNRPQVLAVRLPGHSLNRTSERWLRLHTVELRPQCAEFPKARSYVAGSASATDLRGGRLQSRLQAFPPPLRKHQSRSRRR